MSSGYVHWDDENDNNDNSVNGTVPAGVYDQDTLIHFCCMTSGDVSVPIPLPSRSPFYLFPYTAQCQQVQGMRATQEWAMFDEEDSTMGGYTNGPCPYNHVVNGNRKLFYCYYE